ncbi:hypothetical protein VSR01_27505 [Actinacidiphila sp. DG2A-62]|uniref:hypothetical protein n=1 Tax=Actinacidiphila sp. DG2A-62 TaxID=3108821 RepID=UPI002DBB70A0|nr:hypothetical protein [Actinacidiphila sp. DG2A-62]MEC3997049.1 hypothetical protein [Actinacidiphila sp. DG2A-62]
MTAITGRFVEARLYLHYCVTLLHPGHNLPTFAEPSPYTGNLEHFQESDHVHLVEEGRRQLDRQSADLERIRNRAGALATVSLGLTAAAVAKSADVFTHHWPIIALWAASCLLASLAVAGAAAVLAGQAVLGRTDARLAGQSPRPTVKHLAAAYVHQVSIGEETVRTFLTVFRDAVTLAVISALMFVSVLAFTLDGHQTSRRDPTCPISTSCSQSSQP